MIARTQTVVILAVFVAGAARAESVKLGETPQAGQYWRLAITMKLNGEMVVVQGGKAATMKLVANAEHRFRERVLAVNAGGSLPAKVARIYDTARANINVDGVAAPRSLRPEHRLIVAQRNNDALVCYSPLGSLSRDELDTVSEHFDTLALSGILPNKVVNVGEAWKLTDATAQALCLFDALASQSLSARLSEFKNGIAVIVIEGSAQGIELGAQATVKVSATARFDAAKRHIVALDWKQSDVRDQGPASPAINAESTVSVVRESIDAPTELSDIALVSVPGGFDVPDALKLLTVRDARGRFELTFSRDWQVTGQNDSHVVLRLLDRGEFIAQATVTPWQKADHGQHMDSKAFREAMLATPGWAVEEVLQEGELSTIGRWIYRLSARGQMDGVQVVQSFYLVAGTRGDQAVVVVTFKPAQAAKLGARDVMLLDGLDFEKK